MKGIGEKIRKIRNIRGYSQEYMGLMLKMSQNNYSRIELDQINLTLKTLCEIASVLDIEAMKILNFSETDIFDRPSQSENPNPIKNGYLQGDPVVTLLKEEINSLREDKKRLMSLLERYQIR